MITSSLLLCRMKTKKRKIKFDRDAAISCYLTPSKEWGRGNPPRRPKNRATLPGSDPKIKSWEERDKTISYNKLRSWELEEKMI